MTERDQQAIKDTIPCPLCEGTGSLKENYSYKAQHKYDAGAQSIPRAEKCWFCQGSGMMTPVQQAEWLQFETYESCPQCGGTGGKRYWSWEETDEGAHKEFTFIPCRLCEGKKRISPQQMERHHRERHQLRLWGIGCTVLLAVVVIFGSTTVLTALFKGTPLFRCLPMPGLIPLGIVLLQLSRK